MKYILFLLAAILPYPAVALEILGEWVQGGLLVGKVQAQETVIYQDRQLRVSPQGHFVLGLDRDTPASVSLEVRKGDQVKTYTFDVAQRNYHEQRIDGVPEHTVTPPASVLARIAQEAKLVREARAEDDPRVDFLEGFAQPLQGPITGVYGSRRIFNGIPKQPHYGLDIAAPTGTLVVAPAAGIVRLAHQDMYYSGGTLVLDHGHGVSSTFIHLSELLVEVGANVQRGAAIARVGATGRATGPHLDWRVNWFEVRVDPALVLKNFPARLQ